MTLRRVLVINTLGLNYEGITSVLFNYISTMKRDGFLFDFITFDGMNPDLRRHFERLGSMITVPKRKAHATAYMKRLFHILGKGYDVVHINGNSGTMMMESVLAKICGVHKVIVHCHSKSCSHPWLNNLLVPIMKITSDHYVACSEASGKWLYGKSPFIVLNNAVHLQNYQYNENIRKIYRREMGLGDDFVIGHVGNFYEQKNHSFLLDVFAGVCHLRPKHRLLLVGDGPALDQIKVKTASLGLEEKVVFAGRRSDVNCLYQAMDLFCFPSKMEGFGLAALEAQAAGLPLLVSDGVSREVKCSDNMYYKSLRDGAESWAERIVQIEDMEIVRREEVVPEIRKAGFDIGLEAERLRELYAGGSERTEGFGI